MRKIIIILLYHAVFLPVPVIAQPDISHSVCEGPDKETFIVRKNKAGLVFEQLGTPKGNTRSFSSVIIPAKNGMNFRLNGKPRIACDLSRSAYRGRIYVSWEDLKNGKNNSDIFLVFSDNKGRDWSEPVLLTYHPNHRHQKKPFLYCDSTSGIVAILYHDAKNSFTNNEYDIVLALSKNGGLLFEPQRLSEKKLKDPQFEAEITEVMAGNVRVTVARWQEKNDRSRERFLYLSQQGINSVNGIKDSSGLYIARNFRFSDTIRLPYRCKQGMKVHSSITKPLDPSYELKILTSECSVSNNNSLLIVPKTLGLKKGSYIVTLYSEGINRYCWITEE